MPSTEIQQLENVLADKVMNEMQGKTGSKEIRFSTASFQSTGCNMTIKKFLMQQT